MTNYLFDLDIDKIWISEEQSKEETIEYFESFNREMEKIYQFTLTYYEYLYKKRDYGNGTPMTMLEIHVLTDVDDYPGITVTEIANKWKRTTSAISQIIKYLYDMDLVYRVRNESDGKVNNLFITELGEELVLMHKHYDNIDTIKTLKSMAKEVSYKEIETFFKVAELYKNVIEGSTKYCGDD